MENPYILFDLNSLGVLKEGIFLERINRFVGKVEIDNGVSTVHIADTGRLKEILTTGRKVFLVKNREGLKTDYKLVLADMGFEDYVLVNTSLHSKIGLEAIKRGVLGFIPESIKPEVKYKSSRFDYLVNDNIFVELKASNLLIGNKCVFPDAPTKRGVKHLLELKDAVDNGFRGIILIMGLRNCECFYPNTNLDKEFSDTFFKVLKDNVEFRGFKVKIDSKTKKVVLDGKFNVC